MYVSKIIILTRPTDLFYYYSVQIVKHKLEVVIVHSHDAGK